LIHKDPALVREALLNKDIEWLDGYLSEFEEGRPLRPNEMIMIRELAGWNAVQVDSIEWASIAIRAHELGALEQGGIYRDSALNDAMRIRSIFIAKLGSRPNDPILDKEIIFRWFAAELKLSMEEVRKMLQRLNDPPPVNLSRLTLDEIRALRYLKHRLGVIQSLADCGELPEDSHLHQWLKIRGQLV
jgi:hypothetical protein